ncbi:Hypothetical Protein FCC1311_027612 [Hondaea fermentalgiana]|uniref:UBA domain-containing protein n=1 Tax=Hondaea fermentalgiana TaxID=2315210 RepID=A0A2R5G6B9_9STRA|nr:Hypothetical Protein FCC1311_027612 [Hondaea fermentalgiana]|eukprot:GBG26540.1 Hypothetical Protein FCC1311_027612 [Hondaea fermentalgiana]
MAAMASDDGSVLQQLMDMGFAEEDCKRALAKAEHATVDAAVRSYKCVDTGKLFRTMQDAQLYAERTGHSNFEESDIEVPPLSEEEKAEKLAQLRAKVEERRKQRAEEEKQAELTRELERRRGGREMAAIK